MYLLLWISFSKNHLLRKMSIFSILGFCFQKKKKKSVAENKSVLNNNINYCCEQFFYFFHKFFFLECDCEFSQCIVKFDNVLIILVQLNNSSS